MTVDGDRMVDWYLGNMPCLAATSPRARALAEDPLASATDLRRVVALDPVLLGRLLKLYHSACPGADRKQLNLSTAITVLGTTTVRNLILGMATGTGGLGNEDFWRHSLRVAAAARLLAARRGLEASWGETYFAAGLLHDIGKLPVVWGQPDHREMSRRMARNWRLEGALGDAAAYTSAGDRAYDGPHREVVYTVMLANQFDAPAEAAAGEAWEHLALGPEVFAAIDGEVQAEVAAAESFLKFF